MKTSQGKTAPELIAKPGEYVVEYQLESERGFHFMGSLYFSPNMRFPRDPAHFTSISGEPLGARLTDFEVPDDSWVWTWSRWYVDMTADVDDQGWCYAWRFQSNQWASRHRFLRSFVRQRVWKRPRIKRYLLTGEPRDKEANDHMSVSTEEAMNRTRSPSVANSGGLNVPMELTPTDDDVVLKGFQEEEDEDKGEMPLVERQKREKQRKILEARARKILHYVKSFRNDREKVDGIIQYISTHPGQTELLVAIRDQILSQLSFEISKQSLATRLAESTNENCQLFILAPSNTWRDLVLRRGEPDREPTEAGPETEEQEEEDAVPAAGLV